MASPPFRYRTIFEVAAISIILYIFLGFPGLSAKGERDDSARVVAPSKAKLGKLVYPSKNLQCPRHEYTVNIFSTAPLVIHIDGFLSETEADHLIQLSENKWDISTVSNHGIEGVDDTVRKSEKAGIERDHTVQCIESRALEFQGWPKDTFIEKLWTQRYNLSGHYSLHYDWGSANKDSRRVSSFMVYLQDTCEGGGTHFPRLVRPAERKWCNVIECGTGDDASATAAAATAATGVTFRPKKGTAVFWMNFDEDGRGYKETIHAGMPVISGQKIGLNIWSWYQAGYRMAEEDSEY